MKLFHRKPDFIIGTAENPYLLRWHLIPKNRFFNIYLHKFLRSDDDRALHDHPWASVAIIISGPGYFEHTFVDPNFGLISGTKMRFHKAWKPVFRGSKHAHRIELVKTAAFSDLLHGVLLNQYVPTYEHPVWTIFITGPKLREWGFHCLNGWRHWKLFCDDVDSGKIGRGCD